jgi:Chromo (CHRromatin Organisation MOdifier) domain
MLIAPYSQPLAGGDDPKDPDSGKPIVVGSQWEYEVQEILQFRVDNEGGIWFYIKWKGWKSEYNTWEPIHHLTNCRKLLNSFVSRHVPLRYWRVCGMC